MVSHMAKHKGYFHPYEDDKDEVMSAVCYNSEFNSFIQVNRGDDEYINS